MDVQAKLTNLKNEIDYNIKYFNRKHSRTKHRAYSIKIASVGFSALITVLLGVSSPNFETMFKNLTIVLGACVTIINAIDAFYNYNGLWIKNTITLSKLMELKRELEFYSAGCILDDICEEKLNKYMNELQQILKEDIKQWLRIRERASNSEQGKDSQTLAAIKNKSVDDITLLKYRTLEGVQQVKTNGSTNEVIEASSKGIIDKKEQ
jgi:hypothetical protein